MGGTGYHINNFILFLLIIINTYNTRKLIDIHWNYQINISKFINIRRAKIYFRKIFIRILGNIETTDKCTYRIQIICSFRDFSPEVQVHLFNLVLQSRNQIFRKMETKYRTARFESHKIVTTFAH